MIDKERLDVTEMQPLWRRSLLRWERDDVIILKDPIDNIYLT